MTKSSPKHQKCPQKCAERVEKPPRYSRNSEEVISWTWAYSPYIEIVLKNVLSGSEIPLGESNSLYKVWFATRSSPGHQNVEVYRKSPQKRTQRVAKSPGTFKFTRKFPPGRYLLGVSLSTERVLKNVLSRSKNPPGTVEIARELSPGHELIAVPEIVLKNVPSGSRNPLDIVKFVLQNMICDEIVC